MKMPSREWFIRRISEIEGDYEGEIGAGAEVDFRDGSAFVELLKDVVKPAHDPETAKNDPNIYRYEEDKDI